MFLTFCFASYFSDVDSFDGEQELPFSKSFLILSDEATAGFQICDGCALLPFPEIQFRKQAFSALSLPWRFQAVEVHSEILRQSVVRMVSTFI